MSDKPLSPQSALPFKRQQGPARLLTVGASVTEDEQAEIYAALDEAGYKSASEGAREVLLAWTRGKALPVIPSNERRRKDRRAAGSR